jgi:hypothetical protein
MMPTAVRRKPPALEKLENRDRSARALQQRATGLKARNHSRAMRSGRKLYLRRGRCLSIRKVTHPARRGVIVENESFGG